MKNTLFYAILIVGFVVFFFTARAPAEDTDAPFDGEPEIVVATFSSAWCSACKILKPSLVKVIPDFQGEPVSFVEFDFTFGQEAEIRHVAVEQGFAEIYDRFKGGTGFSLLIDPETGKIVDTLTMNHSSKAMRAAIAQAIAIAQRPVVDQSLENAAATLP